ncbi:MAG TPA: SDR family NAD(P)-dependent oxidoreductase [Nevskiaceae bacterium]|nr:SDR family NAD(P)-dependent oxidoreductase [Nevskiaceae bacterium]
MSDNRTAVVIGVGALRGLGAAVARRFAREGFVAVVAGRTQAQLDAVAQAIRDAGGQAHALVADAASEEQVTQLLERAEAIAPIGVAVYNAGGNSPRASLDTGGEFFEKMWRVGTYGGLNFAREAVRRMLPRAQGTLLFTGASASLRGRPDFVAFAAAKAGLRAVSQSFAREFGPKGIHVAHVVIDGAIDGERIHSIVPQLAKMKGEAGLLDLEAIAEAYWQLHRQHRTAWTQELDLRPYKEPF